MRGLARASGIGFRGEIEQGSNVCLPNEAELNSFYRWVSRGLVAVSHLRGSSLKRLSVELREPFRIELLEVGIDQILPVPLLGLLLLAQAAGLGLRSPLFLFG